MDGVTAPLALREFVSSGPVKRLTGPFCHENVMRSSVRHPQEDKRKTLGFDENGLQHGLCTDDGNQEMPGKPDQGDARYERHSGQIAGSADGSRARTHHAARIHAAGAGLRRDAGHRQHNVCWRRPRRAKERRHLQDRRRPRRDDGLDGPRPLSRPVHRHGAVGHAGQQPDRDRCRRQRRRRHGRKLRALRWRQEMGLQGKARAQPSTMASR